MTRALSNRIVVALALTLIGTLMSACGTSPSDTEALVKAHLSPGDSVEVIEAFIEQQGWGCNYNRFMHRYSCAHPDHDNAPARVLVILIFLDQQGTYSGVESFWSYTWP